MQNPPQSLPLASVDPRIPQRAPGEVEIQAGGVWELLDDRIAPIEGLEASPPLVLVPSEQVLMLAVTLPPMAPSRRREALPFAVEDRIAEPLGQVHVALGAPSGENAWIAGVVRHDVMQQWVARLAQAGLERASLVPDALILPAPDENGWAVSLAGDRALVRTGDGTGFAVSRANLVAAWQAAGQPACLAYGEPLPPPLEQTSAAWDRASAQAALATRTLDLRQGVYAAARAQMNPLWRRVAMVTLVGLAAHGLVAAADILALSGIASKREAEVRALAAATHPGLPIGDDLSAAVADLVPEGPGGASEFRPLVGLTANAMSRLDRPAGWRSLTFAGESRSLTIGLDTTDPAELRRTADALNSAGLRAQPLPAAAGQTTARLLVREP